MKRMILGLAVVLAAMCAWGQENSRVDGCLALQDNQYVLLQGGGTRYQLQGPQEDLKRHVGETVRITGQVFRSSRGDGGLKVSRVERLQPNCGAVPPSGSVPDAVTGKTGMISTAVPDTSTATAGEVTPGYETATGVAQKPGTYTMPTTNAPPPGSKPQPGAPPNWEKVGENPEAANTMAQAAERAEIQPGAAQGTKPDAPESAGEEPAQAPPSEQATQQDRNILIVDGACLPEKLIVRPGEAVQWVNRSRDHVKVAAAGMETATGRAGSAAFSSDLGPGETFHHIFERPGTYRYTCSANGKQKTGKVEVKEE